MRRESVTTRASQIAVTTIVVAMLGGCAQTKGWMDRLGSSPSSSGDSVVLGAPDADQYLTELHNLAAGDPAMQTEIYADAESASTLTPGPSTHLRFALVLATPGHHDADPQRAQSLLRELLTQRELMTSAEISLATIHLKSAEELIVLSSEARRLRASNSRAARTEEAAINQRLTSVEAENRRLRRELDDAEDKLEAITLIERSIRAQDQ